MKKCYSLFLTLVALCLKAPVLHAQKDLMKLSDKTQSGLSARQAANYRLLEARNYYKHIYLVETAPLPGIIEHNTIVLNLPFLPCRSISYVLTGADSTGLDDGRSASPDTYVWSGKAMLDPAKYNSCNYGEMTLVNSSGVFAGTFTIDSRSYELTDLGEGLQAVGELDYSSDRLRNGRCGTANRPPLTTPVGTPPPECDRKRTKVLVLYTDKALAAVPGSNMTAIAQLGIAQLNATLANSWINYTVSLAKVLPLSGFVEGNTIKDDVDLLSANTTVQSLRSQYKAELVVLLTGPEYGTVYGVAKDVGGVKENAYAIVDITQAITTRYSFAHEIGHLYGARHDSDPEPGTAHGYVFNAGGSELRTLMADIYNENRIQHFSSPYVQVQGAYSGTAAYNNNARKVKDMVNYVAGFYPELAWDLRVSVNWSSPRFCQPEGTATATAKCGQDGYTYKWYAGQYINNGSTGSWVYVGSGPDVNTYVPPVITGFNSRPYKVIVTDGAGRSAVRHIYPQYNCLGVYDPGSSRSAGIAITNDLRLYPNPARGNLHIELDMEAAQDATIELLDISGKKLRVLHKGELMKGMNILTVDIGGHAKGLYFIRLQSPGYNKTAKLIIQ